MTRVKSRTIGLAILAITLLGYVFFGRHSDSSIGGTPPISKVSRLPVETFILGQIAPPPQLDAYRGIVTPSKEVSLGFRRGGRIDWLAVEEGSRVRQGSILAKLDSSDLLARLSAAKSQITEAEAVLAELVAGPRVQTIDAARSDVSRLEAALALSQVTWNRERSLVHSSAISNQQFDETRFAVQQCEAALESAKQRLSELLEGTRKEQLAAQRARVEVLHGHVATLEVEITDAQITAPFDGIIAKRYVDEGTISGPAAMILRLIQCDPLEAQFGVAPRDARALQIGTIVEVTVAGEAMEAKVERIEPELDSASRTQGVIVTLLGGGSAIVVPGEIASLAMNRKRGEDAMWVPIGALSRAARGLWSVYAVDVSGIVQRREVQVVETDADLARIVGTMVRPGDRLVAGGIHRITPGMQVTPVESAP